MNEPPTLAPPSPAVREFERLVSWSAVRTALFLLMLASLGSIAAWSRFAPPRTAAGLPEDQDVRAAHALLAGGMRPAAQDLRFTSALAGEVPGPAAPAADREALAAAREHLERARARRPLDPRTLTALAHVESALRRSAAAESHYGLALEFAPHYGEARLGLGVSLAHRSYLSTDALERRRLQLRALAQFAAVSPDDPAYASALYNRAVFALLAGRDAEAGRLVTEYLTLDPSGAWSEHLKALAGRPS
jgi:tetratricopeptide (TPR) repeat protein